MPCCKDRITVALEMPELEVLGVEENADGVLVRVKRWVDMAVCSGCGKTTDRIHSHWETKVRDLPVLGRKTMLVVMKRRFRCLNGCSPFLEFFRDLEKGKRQTKRYRNHLKAACRSTSISAASEKEEIGYKTLDRLYYERAGAKADGLMKQSLPMVMGVDEFSGKRGVRMHVSITDLSGPCKLWDVLKTKGCVEFIDYFKGYSREERMEVKAIVHDMDLGLNSWTKTMFPLAIHVIDKFHLVRTLLKHQERVRKAAYRGSRNILDQKKIRSAYFLIRKRSAKMGEGQKTQLEELFTISKSLKEAYDFKEAFMEWYDRPKRRADAESELYRLHDWLRSLPHLKRFSWALTKWRDEILNYFALTYSNGFTEGMNNKIKTVKRVGYGFQNFDRFRARIVDECMA